MRPQTIASLAVLAWLAGLDQTPPQQPQVRAGVDLFQLEVSVLDRNRQPVRGLTPQDFVVFENGKPQPIAAFSEVAFPEAEGSLGTVAVDNAPDVTAKRYGDRRLFAVILDDWGMPASLRDAGGGGPSPFQMAQDAKAVGREIVESLGPLDFAAIVLTRDTRFFPDFSNNLSKLFGSIDAFKPIDYDSAERMYLNAITRGHIGAIPAMEDVIDYLARLPQRRKAIVYVGLGNGINLAAGSTALRVGDVFRTARAAGISISAVDIAGLTMARRPGTDLMMSMAEETGGYAVVNRNNVRNNFRESVAQIYLENQSYYLIGFEQTGPKDGKFRSLRVTVNRPGLTARARSGYKAPGPPDMVKAPPPPFDPDLENAIGALDSRREGRRLFTEASLCRGQLRVVAEIPAAAGPAWAQGVALTVKGTDGSGRVVLETSGRIEAGARSAVVDAPFANSAGPVRVSVVAKSPTAQIDDGVDVVAGDALLGEPTLFRSGSLPRAPYRPVADREFTRTERLRVEWMPARPLDRQELKLLRRTGEPTAVIPIVSSRDAGGRETLTADFALAALGAGEYALEIIAHSGADAVRKVVAFRVR